MTSQQKAYGYALIAILMWSTVASAFKIALSVLNPELTLFYSSLSASFILLIFFLFSNNDKTFQCKDITRSAKI